MRWKYQILSPIDQTPGFLSIGCSSCKTLYLSPCLSSGDCSDSGASVDVSRVDIIDLWRSFKGDFVVFKECSCSAFGFREKLQGVRSSFRSRRLLRQWSPWNLNLRDTWGSLQFLSQVWVRWCEIPVCEPLHPSSFRSSTVKATGLASLSLLRDDLIPFSELYS